MTHREAVFPDGQLPVAVMCPKFRAPNRSKLRRVVRPVAIALAAASACRRVTIARRVAAPGGLAASCVQTRQPSGGLREGADASVTVAGAGSQRTRIPTGW